MNLVVALLLIAQSVFWYGIRITFDDSWYRVKFFHTSKDDPDVVLWRGTKSIKPDISIVPEVPTKRMVGALSFGDEQFFFRARAFQIQNAGDTFGRTTALRDYDYEKLYRWWVLLDELDSVSDFLPPLVSYYYGASQEPLRDVPYVVDYLEQHADRDPGAKWWWYSQAIYHAKHRLKDTDRALIIAQKLANIPADTTAPLWVRQMPAFILEDQGEYKAACDIIINILDNHEDLKEGELNFMIHFINERIGAMAEADKNNIEIDPRCKAIIDSKEKAKAEYKKKIKEENLF